MKNSTLQKMAIFSSALFVGASAVYVYSPTFGSYAAESQSVEVNLTIASALGIRTSADNLNLEANVGSFVHGSINVDVITNSQYGYTLTLEDSDDESSLVHTNTSVEDKLISDFTGAKTPAEMTDNTWGFSLDESSYYFIPTLGNPVALKRTNAVHSDYDTTAVDFGAKVGTTLTAGTYKDTVKFTAYVNDVDGNPEDGTSVSEPGSAPKRTIKNITNMQDIDDDDDDDDDNNDGDNQSSSTSETDSTSSSICRNTAIGTEAILTDSRNGNTYKVKKLADGNCWMTENLSIANKTITSADSNLPEGETWTIPASDIALFTDKQNTNSVYIDSTYGGYYSFYAATAGWGTNSVNTGSSPYDICPKGWRLPTGGGYASEYQALSDIYNTPELMQRDPGFVLAGYAGNGRTYRQGTEAFYWSGSVSSSNIAYYRNINSTSVRALSEYKYYGHSVRCIAK